MIPEGNVDETVEDGCGNARGGARVQHFHSKHFRHNLL
jgi:hypothetical protein